jgi:hypothetical protein
MRPPHDPSSSSRPPVAEKQPSCAYFWHTIWTLQPLLAGKPAPLIPSTPSPLKTTLHRSARGGDTRPASFSRPTSRAPVRPQQIPSACSPVFAGQKFNECQRFRTSLEGFYIKNLGAADCCRRIGWKIVAAGKLSVVYSCNSQLICQNLFRRLAAHYHLKSKLKKRSDVPEDYLSLCKKFLSYCKAAAVSYRGDMTLVLVDSLGLCICLCHTHPHT